MVRLEGENWKCALSTGAGPAFAPNLPARSLGREGPGPVLVQHPVAPDHRRPTASAGSSAMPRSAISPATWAGGGWWFAKPGRSQGTMSDSAVRSRIGMFEFRGRRKCEDREMRSKDLGVEWDGHSPGVVSCKEIFCGITRISGHGWAPISRTGSGGSLFRILTFYPCNPCPSVVLSGILIPDQSVWETTDNPSRGSLRWCSGSKTGQINRSAPAISVVAQFDTQRGITAWAKIRAEARTTNPIRRSIPHMPLSHRVAIHRAGPGP